jgi:transposase InsO family protein
MINYQTSPRLKKRKYRYPGKANNVCQNLLRIDPEELENYEIIFSDIFEFRLGDGSKIYCCFVIRKKTRQIISFSFGYNMQAGLVVDSVTNIQLINITNQNQVIFHSDQGRQFGAQMTIEKLIEYGITRSMSRAGTPTDNPIAERFVGIFKLAVVERYRYQTLGEFQEFAEKWLNFYNTIRPHESLRMLSPNQYATIHNLETVSYLAVSCAH